MLAIEKGERPVAGRVLRGLRCVAIRKVAEPIERQVFLEWLARIDGLSAATLGRQFLDSDAGFGQVYDTVCAIREGFRLLAKAAREDTPLFARLRRLNGELLAWLSSGARKSVRTTAELKVMPRVTEIYSTTPGAAKGEQTVTAGTTDTEWTKPVDNVKLLLLCATNMAKLMARSSSSVPRINREHLTLISRKVLEGLEEGVKKKGGVRTEEDPEGSDSSSNDDLSDVESLEEEEPIDKEEKESQEVRSFRLAELDQGEGSNAIKIPVIVEELEIARDDYNSADMSERLFSSLESVLSLPASQASRLGALTCAGICHDIEQMHIKLLYRYPQAPDAVDPSRPPRVRHLAEILGIFQGSSVNSTLGLYISIDERLRLARDLAAAVFEFHKIQWWHKSISSYNVLLFFYDDTALPSLSSSVRRATDPPFSKLVLGKPYLIGFSHSRPENAGYSNKMHAQLALFPYCHPDYAGADAVDDRTYPGFLAEYDYYSLGLVLLEIGMWERLGRFFVQDYTLSRDKIRSQILDDLVPVLEGTLGWLYSSEVRACLSGELSGNGEDADPAFVDEMFERMVLRPLETLLQRFDSV
ncbi:hypothetical protein QC763_608100 [Podospora pseudopauciseta]|uniref:Protein kinase domain-containing protein n=1 Tax=Podospora pseudopauciseta TaxID=2093780 RepID=A0ABR0H5T5_9PEZI|nr:hypothetical protein QC763_608100 [Podospora pseudopauciseta]